MKGYWENLRPFEKRVVVGIATLLFVVINFWFVLPRFSDLGKMRQRLRDAQHTLHVRQTAIEQIPSLQAQVNKLQQEGAVVPAEEQALQFARTITDEQMRSGVDPKGGGRIYTFTNLFFLEQTTTINIESNEKQLVDFLFNLGSGSSLIRVRELNLHPDPPRQKLAANVKLVASYQKTTTKSGSASRSGTRAATTSGSQPPSPGPATVATPPPSGKKTNK
jgi:hypothetical protein